MLVEKHDEALGLRRTAWVQCIPIGERICSSCHRHTVGGCQLRQLHLQLCQYQYQCCANAIERNTVQLARASEFVSCTAESVARSAELVNMLLLRGR